MAVMGSGQLNISVFLIEVYSYLTADLRSD